MFDSNLLKDLVVSKVEDKVRDRHTQTHERERKEGQRERESEPLVGSLLTWLQQSRLA